MPRERELLAPALQVCQVERRQARLGRLQRRSQPRLLRDTGIGIMNGMMGGVWWYNVYHDTQALPV